eukprot:15023336-Alexandrium_andersonii.AAC.1
MEALYASCCSEFQTIRGSQQLSAAATESLKRELSTIHQQMRRLEQRTQALESGPVGAGPENSGAAPNPAGSPPASAEPAASGPDP